MKKGANKSDKTNDGLTALDIGIEIVFLNINSYAY